MLGVQGGRERPQERYIGVGGGGGSSAAGPHSPAVPPVGRCTPGGLLHPRAPVGPRAFFPPPVALPLAAHLLHCTAAAARSAPAPNGALQVPRATPTDP